MTLSRRVIAVAICIVPVCAVAWSLRSIMAVKPVMADFKANPVIIIDAGHGGSDGGAVGDGGIIEKDINLAISLTMRDIFTANGFDVIMTRDTDISIHDEGVKGTRNQKVSDIHNRLAVVESHPDAIFLSVHQNKFTSAGSKGAQIFYSPNNPQSEQLAAILQEEFISALQPENHRKYKRADKNLYLMYHAKCPSVLVECGFLSNPEEARRLTDTEYQSQIAFTTFSSVVRFLGLNAIA